MGLWDCHCLLHDLRLWNLLDLLNKNINKKRRHWDLPLRQDRNFDDLDELQLLNLPDLEHCLNHRRLSLHNDWHVQSQPCSRAVDVQSPQCPAWFALWYLVLLRNWMSHSSVGELKLTRASKMRLSTPRVVRNLILFST